MIEENNYDWEQLIVDQIQSKMSMKVFCSVNDIPYGRFKNHVYSIRDSKKPIQFIPVEIETVSTINLIINGNALSINSSIDDIYLKRIIRALSL